ncbi:hypothetical protein E2C01_008486 [Portunus trituberculatus]|uniref:Uncharacterized protein n=1 Tax=Portunus trituberculatus TaxID=210409 RepID=A0A5B7D0Y6_PORTR|nr:hypothetical protein [Portunus trituberculatus]
MSSCPSFCHPHQVFLLFLFICHWLSCTLLLGPLSHFLQPCIIF